MLKRGFFEVFQKMKREQSIFFKNSFEMFSLVMFCIRSFVVRKKGLFVKRLRFV